MVNISDDFVSGTGKVRKTGNSLVIGLNRSGTEAADVRDGSIVQIYFKKIKDTKNESPEPEQSEENL